MQKATMKTFKVHVGNARGQKSPFPLPFRRGDSLAGGQTFAGLPSVPPGVADLAPLRRILQRRMRTVPVAEAGCRF